MTMEDHINIDPKATPVIHPPREIPISLMEKLKAELERMCKLDVIENIDEPTNWVTVAQWWLLRKAMANCAFV